MKLTPEQAQELHEAMGVKHGGSYRDDWIKACEIGLRMGAEKMREQAAVSCDDIAIRLLGGRTRVNQVDRHTAEVLRGRAAAIRSLPLPTEGGG